MRKRIKSHIFDYLNINIIESLDLSLNSVLTDDSYYDVEFSDEEAEIIRDKAGQLLQLKGFDLEYNLTKDGEILEEIIDIFYL